jgi:hypothetical protein
MKSIFHNWTVVRGIIIILCIVLLLGSHQSSIQAQHIGIPTNFSLEKIQEGVGLYKDKSTGTQFVQFIKLDKGATLELLHGPIANPGLNMGPYGGNDPSIWRQTLQETWNEFSSSNNNAFCITNGQFFSTNDNPTKLAFSLKKDGVIVSDGYAVAGVNEEYPGQKLMLEIWSDKADIRPLSQSNLLSSSAPNIIAGLTEDADKGPSSNVGRTFVGVADINGDGFYEVILIFNSGNSTQNMAASVLRSFGAEKVIMLDGGGSTQLICEGQSHISSSRSIPQTLAVKAAPASGVRNVDIALIIDSSGSMTWNDANNKRLDAAKAYLTASIDGDYVGVIDFDSFVRIASPLLKLREYEIALRTAIDTIDSSGGTNIGLGVQRGCDILLESTSGNVKRGAILLTDGVGSYSNQANCFSEKGWPIYAFGFGDANDSLLNTIAVNTGGEYKRLPTSNLVCEFQRVRALIAGVEPGPCSSYRITPFEIIRYFINILINQAQATFSISWPGSDIELSLISPSGRVVDRNTIAPDVIHDFGSGYEVFTILNPEPGEWEVILFGADVPPDGTDVVFGFTSIPSTNQGPILTVPDDQYVQYSDYISFTISAADPDTLLGLLEFTSSNLPENLNMHDNGDGTATISGLVQALPGPYNIDVTVTDPEGLSDTKSLNIIVVPEDARVTYTGPQLVSTSCAECSETSVLLRASIQDITAVMDDIAYDPYPGDISNATINFINRENGDILCSTNTILIDPDEITTGTANCNWSVNIGNSNGIDFTVGMVVGGYYTRNSPEDDILIVVSKPLSNFITGGGHITNNNSGGIFSGDPDAKTNFAVNLKFNPRQTNIIGKVNIIIYKDGNVYQIRTNSTTSLVVLPLNPDNPNSGTAELIAKANIMDLTDPLNPIEILGNATLNFRLKDNGEPGSTDLISVALWGQDGNLLFSSNWDGVQTIPQTLAGGNIKVH